MNEKGRHLLFYDGHCGLCDAAVQFILKRDRHARFVYAPLQGETAKEYLSELYKKEPNLDSMVLVENYQGSGRRVLTRSKAAFRAAWYLGSGWAILGLLSFTPQCFADWGYRIIARFRYRWFGHREVCELPSAENRDRFLP